MTRAAHSVQIWTPVRRPPQNPPGICTGERHAGPYRRNQDLGDWLGTTWWRCAGCGSDVSYETMTDTLAPADA